MTVLGTAILIFLLRLIDVPIGTIRMIYSVRGYRFTAMTLGFFESLVWIIAISQVMTIVSSNRWNMIAWAVGFSVGTMVGIMLEQWIASGSVLARIITIYHSDELKKQLRDLDFGVTAIEGEGKDGSILILFVVTARRRSRQLLEIIDKTDPNAFVTLEPINHAGGGYFPPVLGPFSPGK